MPMQLTVNRNRKTSENYNSEGHGVSITVELDQSLLTRPQDLRHEIDRLYSEADAALDRQTGDVAAEPSTTRRSNAGGNGNGQHPPATKAQRRAIDAICKRLGLDAEAELRDELGLNLDELTIKEASRVIDHLKALQGAGRSNGGGR